MKKILLTVFAAFFALAANSVKADITGIGFGVSVTTNELDTVVTDDIDSNGSIDTTQNLSDSIDGAAIFFEATTELAGPLAVTFGVEYLPTDGDLDERSATQATIKGSGTSSTSGTNKGKATIDDHYTYYVQPGFIIGGNTMIYGTVGYIRGDLTATWESVSSTNTTETKGFEGTKVGAGIKHVLDSGIFVKLDWSETDYDPVSYTTTNNTKVTGDIDNEVSALSIGYQF